jgi:CRP/FNR family transcriptional regulator
MSNENAYSYPPKGGPSIVVQALWSSEGSKLRHVLTDKQRAEIAAVSSLVRFRPGEEIYREGDCAEAVFNIITGIAKSYRSLPASQPHIVGFLFPDDLIGLAEDGRYANSARAASAVCAYRIPVPVLEARLRKDPDLEFHIICKLCHELCKAQRHAFLISRHHALAKIGLFLQMLENFQASKDEGTAEIYLPMSRSDIGDYIGMSLEAVSRAFRTLSTQGVIAFRNRRHIKIIDRDRLNDIASES